MQIDLEKVAKVMIRDGIDEVNFDGWTNGVMDTLGTMYDFESALVAEITKQRGNK